MEDHFYQELDNAEGCYTCQEQEEKWLNVDQEKGVKTLLPEIAVKLIAFQFIASNHLLDISWLLHQCDQLVVLERILEDFWPSIVDEPEEIGKLDAIESDP